MEIDRVNKIVRSEPMAIHRMRLVEREPTEETVGYIRKTPVVVYETTYDSSGKIGQTTRLLSAIA